MLRMDYRISALVGHLWLPASSVGPVGVLDEMGLCRMCAGGVFQ
jgi:hypothetical protein